MMDLKQHLVCQMAFARRKRMNQRLRRQAWASQLPAPIWPKSEIDHLRMELAAGASYEDIAFDLDRRIVEVKRKARDLGIAKWMARAALAAEFAEIAAEERMLRPAPKREYSDYEMLEIARKYPSITGLSSISKQPYRRVFRFIDLLRSMLAGDRA